MKLPLPITLKQAGEILNCEFVGPEDHVIEGINEIHMVEPGDLTFVDIEKYYDKALNSAATTVLINKETEVPPGKGLLISDDPFRDINRLTEHFLPSKPLNYSENPVVAEGAKLGKNFVCGENVHIGKNTEIGHNVVVGSHVTIGENCRIHANVTIYDHCIIGDEVCINSGTVIGGEAFYFKARPYGRDKFLSKGRVIIDDHVDIGANCGIDKGVTGDTRIGAWTKLDSMVMVGHDTVIGKKCIIAAQCGIAGVCIIEDEVILWGQVGVSKETHIQKGAIVLSKSGAEKVLEAGNVYFGIPTLPARQRWREIATLRKLTEKLGKIMRLIE